MQDWRKIVGAAVGLTIAFFVVRVLDVPGTRRPSGPLARQGPVLSDCTGRIRELVVQYVAGATDIVADAYPDFVRQLAADVTVYVVCPDQAAFDDFRNRVYPVRCQVRPVFTGCEMTCWARDRWLALAPGKPGAATCLLAPCQENGAEIWPARRGDHRVADFLAQSMPTAVVARRSRLAFDGGDFVADARTAFVTPRVARRNVGSAVSSASALRRELLDILKREMVLLTDAPPHHAGMFMMPVAGKRMLVGDPSLAKRFLTDVAVDTLDFPDPDFSADTQQRFDAVAAACSTAGYDVVRIPVVPGTDARSYWSYVNVLIDERDDCQIVYMPVYRTAEVLNEAAATVWRKLGYEVRAVDCTRTFRHCGSLRCLVNVLTRDDSGAG